MSEVERLAELVRKIRATSKDLIICLEESMIGHSMGFDLWSDDLDKLADDIEDYLKVELI